MAIQFPADPTVGEVYLASNGIYYTWTGTVWSADQRELLIPDITDQEGKFLSTDGETLLWAGINKIESFRINYSATGHLNTISEKTEGLGNVTINNSINGDVSITFNGYTKPPASIVSFGYDYTNNKYYVTPLETSMTLREIPGGGTSGNPTAFVTGITELKLRLREAETGASRGTFGTTTHAYVIMALYN